MKCYEKVPEEDSWRGRIETNIRELEKFKPFTTSRSMKLRRLYLLISMTMYNLWILTRNGKEHPRAHEFKDWLEIELITTKVLEEPRTNPPHSQLCPKMEPQKLAKLLNRCPNSLSSKINKLTERKRKCGDQFGYYCSHKTSSGHAECGI